MILLELICNRIHKLYYIMHKINSYAYKKNEKLIKLSSITYVNKLKIIEKKVSLKHEI